MPSYNQQYKYTFGYIKIFQSSSHISLFHIIKINMSIVSLNIFR